MILANERWHSPIAEAESSRPGIECAIDGAMAA